MPERARDPADAGVRLAELVASLSLATDLGLGLSQEHVLCQTLIALRLASAEGFSDDELAVVYYVSLLAWVGCVADAHEMATWFGDDLRLHADSYGVDKAGMPMMRFILSHLGRGRSGLHRTGTLGRFLLSGIGAAASSMTAHCEATGDLALRLGLGARVREPLQQVFERWDGRGVPGRRRGDELDPVIRVVHVADEVEVYHRLGGIDAAVEVTRSRRGTEFDPQLVDRFCRNPSDILGGLPSATWDAVIAAAPTLEASLSDAELSVALEVFADYADLKSPFRLGRSRGVADLAERAARRVGLPPEDVTVVRLAALVQDIGGLGVSNSIWDKPGELTQAEWERIRTHPYLTERVLARPAALARLAAVAGMHHERLDGSGYPRGLRGESIPLTARVLAAADTYHALREARPHRPARSADEAQAHLRGEVAAGRLDGEAVNAVLGAAGHRVRRRADLPAGLTPREAEVLVLLARGCTNREIARQLTISMKTADAHVQHIYTKMGVSTRGAAALFAMRHGLVSLFEAPSQS